MKSQESDQPQILTIDQLKSIYDQYCSHTYISQTTIRLDWIDFQYKALTSGVNQFDIDMIALSYDDFELKYGD